MRGYSPHTPYIGLSGSGPSSQRVTGLEAEHLLGARGVRRHLDQAEAVLVPEHLPGLDLGKYPRVADRATVDGQPAVARHAARAQPGDEVAEVIDVDDFTEFAGAEGDGGSRFLQLGGLAVAARQHRGDRCEQVAAMEGIRQVLRPPADREYFALLRARRGHGDEAVIGPDEPAAIGGDRHR